RLQCGVQRAGVVEQPGPGLQDVQAGRAGPGREDRVGREPWTAGEQVGAHVRDGFEAEPPALDVERSPPQRSPAGPRRANRSSTAEPACQSPFRAPVLGARAAILPADPALAASPRLRWTMKWQEMPANPSAEPGDDPESVLPESAGYRGQAFQAAE